MSGPPDESALAAREHRRWLIGVGISVVFGLFSMVMALLSYAAKPKTTAPAAVAPAAAAPAAAAPAAAAPAAAAPAAVRGGGAEPSRRNHDRGEHRR